MSHLVVDSEEFPHSDVKWPGYGLCALWLVRPNIQHMLLCILSYWLYNKHHTGVRAEAVSKPWPSLHHSSLVGLWWAGSKVGAKNLDLHISIELMLWIEWRLYFFTHWHHGRLWGASPHGMQSVHMWWDLGTSDPAITHNAISILFVLYRAPPNWMIVPSTVSVMLVYARNCSGWRSSHLSHLLHGIHRHCYFFRRVKDCMCSILS